MNQTTMQPDKEAVTSRHEANVVSASHSIAIICGGGSFPGAVAEAAQRRGRRPVMLGLKGWADPGVIERYAHHWLAIGQLGRVVRLAHAEGCQDALFIGTLLRPPLSQIRLDWQTIRSMPRILRSFRGGDDKLLTGIASLVEDSGLRMVGLQEVAPEIFVPEGIFGHYRPTKRDSADIARGLQVIAALGPFDVGQAAIVADNQVLAVEAAEGTDHLLARIADLRQQRRVTTPSGVGVLVKAPKPGQDRRFDLPSIGPTTIANVVRAGLAGLAVSAGSTIVADGAEVAAAADRAGIFVVGVDENTTR